MHERRTRRAKQRQMKEMDLMSREENQQRMCREDARTINQQVAAEAKVVAEAKTVAVAAAATAAAATAAAAAVAVAGGNHHAGMA